MILANFLHLYQPPTQTKKILAQVTKESYKKIFKILLESRRAKITLNITGGLTEMWASQGYDSIINQVKQLLKSGKVELTDSAIYHPFLPGLPESEIIRQTKLNRQINRKLLGKDYRPVGFFPPEMAYEPRIGKIIAKLGYAWMILDEASDPRPRRKGQTETKICEQSKSSTPQLDSSPTSSNEKKALKVFFRERALSFLMLSAQISTGPMLARELKRRLRGRGYVITAMDGETFGHHRPGLEQLLAEMFANKEIKTATISELINQFKERETIKPLSATWALMNTQMARNAPFARWNDPENPLHQMQWHLTHLAIKAVSEAKGKIGNKKQKNQWKRARAQLDQALHSDQYWWASAKPWWSLEIIEKGAKELVETIACCPLVPLERVEEAKDLYAKIIFTGFDWQRTGQVENLQQEHQDEELAFGLQLETPDVPEEEYRKIVARLKEQEKQAVRERNYDLAKRFKERLEQLEWQRKKIQRELNSQKK